MITILKNKISVVIPEIHDLQIYTGPISVTYNKKNIYLKVKKKNGEYYDVNTLVYVTIHEISHVICDKYDYGTKEHGPEFNKVFDKLINKCIDKGVFNPAIPLDKN
jgi:hypothetical protein